MKQIVMIAKEKEKDHFVIRHNKKIFGKVYLARNGKWYAEKNGLGWIKNTADEAFAQIAEIGESMLASFGYDYNIIFEKVAMK